MNARREPALPRLVALKYARGEESAPRVVAKGEGELARALLLLAEKHHVPVREDADLVALLSALELGDEIPGELYHAVAVLLTELARCNEALSAEG
jgi:flagellar biosynthesis protein